MKKTLSLLLFVVLAWPSLVFGELTYAERSLQGIDAFRVEVEVKSVDDVFVASGFNTKNYKTAIELRLRSLGILVDDSLDAPALSLSVLAMRVGDLSLYVGRTNLEFVQEAFISGKGSRIPFFTLASTWGSNNLLYFDANNVGSVKDAIFQGVDDFANDYFKANPPELRSDQGSE